jgi:hypothetical protein
MGIPFLDFLAGNQSYHCSPLGNPTRTVFGRIKVEVWTYPQGKGARKDERGCAQ